MVLNFTLIIKIILGLLTGTAATLAIVKTVAKKWIKVLPIGKNIIFKGITAHHSRNKEYYLSIKCNKGTEGEDSEFDVKIEDVNFEFNYRGKDYILTAIINESNETIIITVIQA